jgi:hypothetical protein
MATTAEEQWEQASRWLLRVEALLPTVVDSELATLEAYALATVCEQFMKSYLLRIGHGLRGKARTHDLQALANLIREYDPIFPDFGVSFTPMVDTLLQTGKYTRGEAFQATGTEVKAFYETALLCREAVQAALARFVKL